MDRDVGRGIESGPVWPADGVVMIRPLGLGDVDAHLAGEDRELARWLNGGSGTRETVQTHVRRVIAAWRDDGPTFGFGIRTLAGDVLVGTIDAHLEPPYLGQGQVNLAYGLYPWERGKGLATRAVVLVCRFLAARPEPREAVIRVHRDNPASAAVARRAGFRSVGPHRDHLDQQDHLDWYTRHLMRATGLA